MGPTRLGPYAIVHELGRGAMGTVYAARRGDGSPVALKVLLNKGDGQPLARFVREHRLLTGLAAAGGFVPVLDAGEADGVCYLVMPLLAGGTLRDLLEAGPLPVEEAVSLVAELAESMGRAHAQGIVHRDLKPENVLFDQARRPVIADLGLAKHFAPELDESKRTHQLSKSGVLLGTIGYAAPEQITDSKAVGPTADVYALAVILYECVTGVPPFAADSTVATITRQATERYPKIRELVRAPRALDALVARAFSMRPEERYADGADLARALRERALLSDLPGGRAGKIAIVAGGALLLLGIGGGAGWLARHATPRPPIAGASPRATTAPNPSPSPASNAIRDRARTLIVAGQSALRARKAKAARDAFDEAIALDPSLADGWAGRGELRAPEDSDGGLADAEHALTLDARNVQALLARSIVRFKRGDSEGALADTTRAIELDPRSERPWLFRAVFYEKLKDLDHSLADTERAIEIRPDAFTYANRAAIQYTRGQLATALEDLNRAIALDPEYESAWANRASVRTELGDLAGALSDADRAIELDPKDDGAYLHRAVAHMKRDEEALAIADFRKALELAPQSQPALANLALMLANAHQLDEARRLADRAVAAGPDNPHMLALRGHVRELAGDKPGAIRDLERALQLGLAGPKADLARQSLESLRR